MTAPTAAAITTQLRHIALLLRDHTTTGPLADAGQQLAVIAEQLRGRTLITLPEPDETPPAQWHLETSTVEVGETDVWLDGQRLGLARARELGLALLAAATLVAAIDLCPATNPTGYACTREAGHDGNHQATNVGGRTVLAEWADTEETSA